ncbi:hypothetical protein FACS1894111_05050 [Clostridia bacterium]|nr:hypothetical protein FACS1894111_05050 [Clostridia bacterium]
MASLMDSLFDVLEKETAEYECLIALSSEKRRIIIDADIAGLEEITQREQDVINRILHLENKREEITDDMATVLSKDPKELTITNMVAFLHKQPKEQERLRELRDTLRTTLRQMEENNRQNDALLQQAMEMVEFDLMLFKSLRQAPATANYNNKAYNTGDILPSRGFDAKQ